MAGKKQKFDNSQFTNIAGGFGNYNDLTTEGKNIVGDIIDKCAGTKGYPRKKVYYVLYNCHEITRDSVMYWLQYFYGMNKDDSAPNDNTARKFVTITKQLSVAMVKAHNEGVKLFKHQKEGMYYPTPVQKYELDKMYNDGLSAQEMILALQKMIDDSAK
ncbi:hypothetical protein [Enterobacter kobei]|uniref:hypothetical protein n=1 Tax=Enterobacter kobei TaxID=208224 RepID=UPI0024493A4D|nr:hypothetical protein [Enterobacter kobei]MDH1372022.1 hypothetical protein [Enterobacter kobei]MDH1990410.1 hypothetical protein [Enterobacter kobei]MDH2008282.1 hypothetical protein [Enterobacter kobei]